MHGKVKISKRQIKEDKFTTLMLTTKDRLAENWQFVAIGAVAVILIITAITYYINANRSAQEEASERFARALLDYRNNEKQIAILSLNSIIEDFSGSDVAEQATLYLAKLNFLDRNYVEATRFYQAYLDTYQNNRLNRATAMAGLAACHENQGQYADAASMFSAAADENPGGPLEGDYLLGALRNYLESDQAALAREKLDIIAEKYKGTEFDQLAERLMYEKGKAQPEL